MTSHPHPTPLVPVAFLGRTSTLVMQDPAASMRRQLRSSQDRLPDGWTIAAYFWDIESGGLDLEERGQSNAHLKLDVGVPRDGGLADLIREATGPSPRFAAVICEDIERSARDTFAALKLEKLLTSAGIPLFAADEPIAVDGADATTVLVRRMKQGVAEWFRLQLKEKMWKGLREHTIDGWNIGPAPYGYLPERVPHPNPAKASLGRTKTRLVLDPVPAGVVEEIFTWRVPDKTGITTITQRLNNDHHTYPPPKGDTWTPQGVYAILANPKYTGHMVWNRTTGKGGRRGGRQPPEAWIWSPQQTHPAIISRETFDTAQHITLNRASITGEPGAPAHPLARQPYELRSRIRHRTCKRRMCGITRDSGAYYACPHDVTNPRHAAKAPNHPRFVGVRQDTLVGLVCDFITTRVLGPERATLLGRQLPADAAEQAARIDKQRDRLRKELKRIDAAQRSQIRQIDTLPTDPANRAAQAMRARCFERFAELQAERDHTEAQLTGLNTHHPPPPDPGLLDALPVMTARLDELDPRERAAIYQALDIEIVYSKELNQVTIYATITDRTPQALAALIHDSEPPTTTPANPGRSDFHQAAMAAQNNRDHESHRTRRTVFVSAVADVHSGSLSVAPARVFPW